MHKAQGLGVQGLPGHHLKRVFDEIPVAARALPVQDLVAAVGSIGEERVADVLHVYPNLVGTAGFKVALHQ